MEKKHGKGKTASLKIVKKINIRNASESIILGSILNLID